MLDLKALQCKTVLAWGLMYKTLCTFPVCIKLVVYIKVPSVRGLPSLHRVTWVGWMTDISTNTVLDSKWNCRGEATFFMFPKRHQSFWSLMCWLVEIQALTPLLLFKAFNIFKAISPPLTVFAPLALITTDLYTDPNSAIQASYFSRSAAETDFEIFLSVSVKSSMVTGICSSSLDRARISSGLRPWIRRRIAIMEASLTYV